MNNILSHSFTFQIHSSTASNGEYENILHLSDDDSIDLRHMSIKVDRSYFLEIANVCIDNRNRRRHFFATLGKRRFGASNKHLDCYFSHTSPDEKVVLKKYLNHYENIEFEAFFEETTKYSTNKYRVYIEQENDIHIIFLDQLNITSRKRIHKIFSTDITIVTAQQKVNYIFNKIGKKYFKSLELALSMLITGTSAMERSSRIQDNTTFRKL